MTSIINFIRSHSMGRWIWPRDANRRAPRARSCLCTFFEGRLVRAPIVAVVLLLAHAAAMANDPVAEALRQRLDQLTASTGDSPQKVQFAAPDVLQRFYESRDFAPAWDDAH